MLKTLIKKDITIINLFLLLCIFIYSTTQDNTLYSLFVALCVIFTSFILYLQYRNKFIIKKDLILFIPFTYFTGVPVVLDFLINKKFNFEISLFLISTVFCICVVFYNFFILRVLNRRSHILGQILIKTKYILDYNHDFWTYHALNNSYSLNKYNFEFDELDMIYKKKTYPIYKISDYLIETGKSLKDIDSDDLELFDMLHI